VTESEPPGFSSSATCWQRRAHSRHRPGKGQRSFTKVSRSISVSPVAYVRLNHRDPSLGLTAQLASHPASPRRSFWCQAPLPVTPETCFTLQ
jgi:hypothetical protein